MATRIIFDFTINLLIVILGELQRQHHQITYKDVFLCLRRQKSEAFWSFLVKNLSAREVSKVLGVSRNIVAEVQILFLQSGRSWDGISEWDNDRLYELFYPDKFKYKPRYAPVDYSIKEDRRHRKTPLGRILCQM